MALTAAARGGERAISTGRSVSLPPPRFERLPQESSSRSSSRSTARATAGSSRRSRERVVPDARSTLEKRPLKVLHRVLGAADTGELADVLGPRVAARHPLDEYRGAARALVAEREQARARRLGEPLLSETEQRALGAAGSRLLGLAEERCPLANLEDRSLEAVRRERDPAKLAERLAVLDPEGNWEEVPRVGALAGLVMVAAASEAERRWRLKNEANQARTRSARSRNSRAPAPAAAS